MGLAAVRSGEACESLREIPTTAGCSEFEQLFDMTSHVLGEGAEAEQALECLQARFDRLIIDDELYDSLCQIDEAVEVLDTNDQNCVQDEKAVLDNRKKQHKAYTAEFRSKAARVRAEKSKSKAPVAEGKASVARYTHHHIDRVKYVNLLQVWHLLRLCLLRWWWLWC